MACFHPLDAFQGPCGGPVSFKATPHFRRYLQIPCGQCIGCRLERSRQWAMRCVHEASLWDFNCFVTLTYDDDHLPLNGSLVKADHQKFIKRLRDRLDYPPMKYYMCGEYGETYGRPHYHFILFGIDFADKLLFKTTQSGHKLYTSALLDDIWGLGHCQIGSVTFDSAAYVARYIMKKMTGPKAFDAYNVVDPSTGEVLHELLPEYNDMSRASGVGREWFEKFRKDTYPRDYTTMNGVKVRPPRYYDKRFEMDDPLLLAWIKHKRKLKALSHADDNTPDRLAVRELVTKGKVSRLNRPME